MLAYLPFCEDVRDRALLEHLPPLPKPSASEVAAGRALVENLALKPNYNPEEMADPVRHR